MRQILRVNTSRKPLPDLILTAGDPQVSICSSTVYLEATISPGGVGHPTEWVQLSGSPTVSLIYVSPTQSYYETGGITGSDKTFRFYMDRGTQLESYRDVTVYTTPTDDVTQFNIGVSASVVSIDPKAFALVSNVKVTALSPFDSNVVMGASGDTVAGNLTLEWGVPTLFLAAPTGEMVGYAQGWQGSVVQQWGVGGWTTVQTYTTLDVRQYTVSSPQRLRVGSLYSLAGHGSTVMYGDWFGLDPSITLAAVGNASLSNFSVGDVALTSAITRLVYTLTMLEYTDDVESVSLGSGDVVGSSVVAYVYVLLPQDGVEQVESFSLGSGSVNFAITRVSGGSLGG